MIIFHPFLYHYDDSICHAFPSALPKIIPFSFGEVPSNLGDSASIQCGVSSGDLPIEFSWFLNDRLVDKSDGVSIGKFGKKTSFLSIDSLAENHAGNYSCSARNKAGIGSYASELVVIGSSLACSTIYFFKLKKKQKGDPYSFLHLPFLCIHFIRI